MLHWGLRGGRFAELCRSHPRTTKNFDYRFETPLAVRVQMKSRIKISAI
jgi:hypothetical protein